MNRNYKFFSLFILTFSLVLFSGCELPCGWGPFRACPKDKITLVIWNLFDDSDTWDDMIKAYTAASAADITRPKIKIEYYKRSISGYENYEQELSNAMASGMGPDIYVIHNDWVDRYKNKIIPFDEGAKTAQSYERKFADVVSNDFLIDNKIYGVPLSVDTLALYYNKTMFKNAGIYDPPRTWDEFKDVTERLTLRDDSGGIMQAGAALGTEKNVNRASDILALLMLQSGSTITDKSLGVAVFNKLIDNGNNSEEYSIGGNALQFYTDFANSGKRTYTWNPVMDYSIDAFYQARAAMMFNYSYNIPVIKSKAPKLDFAIAPMPQIAGTTIPINYANYWAMTVSATSKYPAEAWKFLTYISNPEVAKIYLTKAGKPVAQKDLVSWQENGQDLNLGVFARQSLTARSWFQADPLANEAIFLEAIKNVNLGRTTPEEASSFAGAQMTQSMKSKR